MREIIKKPDTIIQESGFCGGCGHGVIQRLIAECVEELHMENSAISVVDIACCFWALDALNYDGIAGPHGRCAAVASAIKKCRSENLVFAYAGDGASYVIGLSETNFAAIRDVPITLIVANNGIFGMTGGQMSLATTLVGDKTSSSPYGRNREIYGQPFDSMNMFKNYDIEYAARGALYEPKEVIKTKKYLKKAFQNNIDNKGFSVVEILTACPTNWGLTPIKANEKVKEEMVKAFPIGEFVDRGGKK